jgi:cell division protease FtsH
VPSSSESGYLLKSFSELGNALEEVNRIVKWAYERAVSLLTSHRETLDSIAHFLRLHETLDARQLRAILEDTHAVHTGPL